MAPADRRHTLLFTQIDSFSLPLAGIAGIFLIIWFIGDPQSPASSSCAWVVLFLTPISTSLLLMAQVFAHGTSSAGSSFMKAPMQGAHHFCLQIDSDTPTLTFITPETKVLPNPLQYSCLENPMDRGARQATDHRVAESGHN